ncbi:G patch domain-containing protein 4 [Lutzomyia longipalpis]|uniref:G patch domain-containing protein 4 n=1 Tax=Lutzomyia longipalpis TaxID=7200 RepID=A0A1B0CF47_LUTLO|nr:G patch domain-containing protein 4 [Lutzomyia longipalpis]XP_055686506.1 G patch domain-containing protein 4 [Lutzomyia longipalpis]XP_055686507.1 G patch domain-containing protein 4 [Lutzomyia longipalpis]XP_055686508.1 G patch domain-containing protein 4 [Lutzomyia longipalpis]XP_055686509.1 G patch domain-containing protein 4 [Lutzomyia longipalpis]
MNFAQSILQKYGWSEGQGLGKHNSGISKPLKANLKFDTSGLGHDGAAEFKNNWWENAYNSASANLDVKSDGESVKMELKDGESIKISTCGYARPNQSDATKSSTYGNFVRCATLTAEGREDRIEEEDGDTFTDYTPLARPALNDDDLFRACGGRTAHKGARHGLTLSGKLARLAEQDNLLLQKMGEDKKAPAEDFTDWQTKVSKRKKKRRPIAAPTPHGSPEAASDELQDLLYLTEYLESPAARRREGKVDRELSEATEKIDLSAKLPKDGLLKMNAKSHEIHKKIKKKKKKHREAEDDTQRELLFDFQETLKKRIADSEKRWEKTQKKSKRKREAVPEMSGDYREASNSTDCFGGGGETSRSHKRLRVTDDPIVDRGVFETSTGIEVELDDSASEHRTECAGAPPKKSSKKERRKMRHIMDKFAKSLTTKEPSDDEGIDP